MSLATPELSKKDILQAAERWSVADLNEFIAEVLRLRARRVAPTIPEDESTLLQQIAQGILPPEQHRRYHELRRKFDDEAISSDENTELLKLSDEVERRTVTRLSALIRLGEKRGKTLDEVMKDLGIGPRRR